MMSDLVGKNCPSQDLYATVDLSTKQKNVSKPANTLSTNVELYSVVDKNRPHREKPQNEDSHNKAKMKNSQPASSDEGNNQEYVYSVLGREGSETKTSLQTHTLPNSENRMKSIKADHKVACEAISFITIVLLILALVVCTAISFSMITMLRSDVNKFLYKIEVIREMASNNSIQVEANSVSAKALNLSFFKNLENLVLLRDKNTFNLLAEFEANFNLIFNATLGLSSLTPAASCQAIHKVLPSAVSGYYYIKSSNGSSVQVYCEMTMKCNGTRGLQRVALINNKTRSEVCVGELTTLDNFCISRNMTPGCSHVIFPVHNVSYSHICGLIEGYSMSTPDGFKRTMMNGEFYWPENSTINDNYVDGISLTYGQMPNRQQIWTFVMYVSSDCEQNKPDFVSNSSFSCFHKKTMPRSSRSSFSTYFFKQLQWTTSEDIEARLCRDQGRDDEDVAINDAEIYVW